MRVAPALHAWAQSTMLCRLLPLQFLLPLCLSFPTLLFYLSPCLGDLFVWLPIRPSICLLSPLSGCALSVRPCQEARRRKRLPPATPTSVSANLGLGGRSAMAAKGLTPARQGCENRVLGSWMPGFSLLWERS